jgi:hypothetical protein
MKNQEKFKLNDLEFKSIGLDYDGCIASIKAVIISSVNESAQGYTYLRFLKKLRFWVESEGTWSPTFWIEKEIVAHFASLINHSNITATDINKCANCWHDAVSGTAALFIKAGIFNDEQEQQKIVNPVSNTGKHFKKKNK